MALFWLFSRDLTASHERAWALTREAAAANSRASERARQLQYRTEQLESKNAELNDFLYVVSHARRRRDLHHPSPPRGSARRRRTARQGRLNDAPIAAPASPPDGRAQRGRECKVAQCTAHGRAARGHRHGGRCYGPRAPHIACVRSPGLPAGRSRAARPVLRCAARDDKLRARKPFG
jgi:hypothetical protein